MHLVTGDDAHYVAMVQELEALGAKVIPVFAGGLDFSKPVDAYLYEPTTKTPLNETFIKDEAMRQRLMNLNPHSFRKVVSTLLEVNGRGYWETSESNLELLRQLYQEVEDRIEGIE